VSGRGARSKRRGGHPARVAARQRPKETTAKPRPARGAPAGGRAPRRERPRAAEALSTLRQRFARRWQSLLRTALTWSPGGGRPRPAEAPPGAAAGAEHAELAGLLDLEAVDVVWALATGALSAALFATALSTHPPLSDGSEGAAGAVSLGILHAPGYPSWVLAAHLFTLIVPVGSAALRVGLFSLLCAAASVTFVQMIARRCGAARWAASLGALCLAATAGYWYYAVFTKHDQFSGLTFVAALYLLLAWEARPSRWRLVALAAVLAIGLGSSWPLTIMLGPVLVYVLARSRHRLTLGSFAAATAVGLVLLAGIYGFVMVRAAENPQLNWGDATTLSRLVSLVDRSDFSAPTGDAGSTTFPWPRSTVTGSPGGTAAGQSLPVGGAGAVLGVPIAAGRGAVGLAYFEMFVRELGIAGSLLALWGLVASLAWRRRRASWVLLGAFLTNLVGVGVTVAPRRSGRGIDLIEEGFVLGCYFVLACWIAIAATDLATRLHALLARRRPGARLLRRALTPTVASALAAAAIVPLLIVGWPVAHRSDNAYADRYAETVFSELPPHAILFVWGSDLNFPLQYRQIAYHQRTDVTVVAVGGLRFRWYRQELSRTLGRRLPPLEAKTVPDVANVIRWAGRLRPVYIDEQASEFLSGVVGFQTIGLVSRVTPGTTKPSTIAPALLQQRLLAAERFAGMPSPDWTVWPNLYLNQADYASVGLKAARYFYDEHDIAGLRGALLNVARIDPGNQTARQDLSLLGAGGGAAG
jgi:hypothetical protein